MFFSSYLSKEIPNVHPGPAANVICSETLVSSEINQVLALEKVTVKRISMDLGRL